MDRATYTNEEGARVILVSYPPHRWVEVNVAGDGEQVIADVPAAWLLKFALTANGIARDDVSAAILSLTWNPADPFSYANAVTDVVCRLFGISEEGQS